MFKMDYKRYWNDPVWSKVIAACIILIVPQIYVLINGLIKNLNFIGSYKQIIESLNSDYSIPAWVILIAVIIIFVFIILYLKNIKSFKKQKKEK